MAPLVNIPTALQQALRDGRVTPFVGAGVSRAVARRDCATAPLFPSWWELLDRGAGEIAADKPRDAAYVRAMLGLDEPKYVAAAEHLRTAMQGAQWARFLSKYIDPPRHAALDASLGLGRAVWTLASQLVITTNYDRVLDWACPRRDDLSRVVNDAPAKLAELVRGEVDRPTVWYLHGHIDNVDSLVLTPGGYEQLYASEALETRYQAALDALRQHLTRHTLLFVGFSLDDEYVGTTLRGVFDRFHGYAGTHFALVRKADANARRHQDLPVEPVVFEDYGDLVDLVHTLAQYTPGGSGSAQGVAMSPAGDKPAAASHAAGAAAIDARGAGPVDAETNPFGATTPIRDPDRFIGRAAEWKTICSYLRNGWVALTGAPKIGKSSMLHHIARTWNIGTVLGPIDLQGCEDFDDLCWHLAEPLGVEINPGRSMWRAVREVLRERSLLVLLDEVDCGPGRCLDSKHLGLLRALVSANPQLRVVTASRRPVKEVFPDTGMGSPPYNYLQPLELGVFTVAEARSLLAHPWAPGGRHFAPDDIAALLAVAGLHPCWLQRAAYHCYEALRRPDSDWRSAWQRDRENLL